MASFSIFLDFTTPSDRVNIIALGKDIINGKYKDQVEQYRKVKTSGDKDKADALKKKLPAFTPSGVFHTKRNAENLEMYSGYIGLDFDKITLDQIQAIKQIISDCPYTALCFVSPSGDGLKVFVEVNSTADHHALAYQKVKDHYDNLTGLVSDEKCKDIPRLCFMSYDPDAFRNLGNIKFIVIDQNQESKVSESVASNVKKELPLAPSLDIDFRFRQQVEFTDNKAAYIEGHRNNYIYTLASNCVRAGFDQDDVERLCLESFDLNPTEIKQTIRSAYKHHPSEFGKFASLGSKKSSHSSPVNNDTDSDDDYLNRTPTLPDEIFDILPNILKEGCKVFPDKRKRDVFFTSALSILSGCLPKVSGVYAHEIVYPHLYTLVAAPPASGKGVLKNAKRLADKYHERVLEASRKAQASFEGEMAEYKDALRNKKKTDPVPDQPIPPAFAVVYIPADSSASKMLDHLQKNGGQGIICESEADTMSGAKKQDWGDYSPILRSAYHHETYSQSRKTDNTYIEIKEPRLAVCLSGTPAQVPRLISSAEDGLFSRFIFYIFKNDLIWQDPSPHANNINYNLHFDELSSQVLLMVDFLSREATTFELSFDQWSHLNTTFASLLNEVGMFTSEDASSVVYRLGLITFRIAMIFTAMRKFDNAESSSVIYCSDDDFESAIKVSQIYLQHAILMFNNLPNKNDAIHFKVSDNKRQFMDALPNEFSRQQAVDLGVTFDIKSRTVDNILKLACGSLLQKSKPGHYSKIIP